MTFPSRRELVSLDVPRQPPGSNEVAAFRPGTAGASNRHCDRIRSEVIVGPEDGLPRDPAIRCDFLALRFEDRLTGYVSTLEPAARSALDAALAYALEIDPRKH